MRMYVRGEQKGNKHKTFFFKRKETETMEESRTFLDKQDAIEVIKKCYEEGKISREDCKVLLDRLNLCPTLTIRGPEKAPEVPYISVTDVCTILSEVDYRMRSYMGFDVTAIMDEFSEFISKYKTSILKTTEDQKPAYKEFTAADIDLLLLKIQNEIENRTYANLVGEDVRRKVANIIEYHRKQLRKDMGEQERVVVLDTVKEKLEFALGLLQQVKEDIDK